MKVSIDAAQPAFELSGGEGNRNMLWIADADFTEFVQLNRPRWLRLAIVTCGNAADGEDALQDAIVSVARVWPRLGSRGASAYMRRAIVRKSIDLGRKRREIFTDTPPDRQVGGDLLRYQQDQDFFARIAELPPNQRAALVCRFYLDLPDAETARAIGCSRETVRSHIHRGLEQLRAETGTTDYDRSHQ
jgi:RNA polymerase sigma factor (sigma-70 family)